MRVTTQLNGKHHEVIQIHSPFKGIALWSILQASLGTME